MAEVNGHKPGFDVVTAQPPVTLRESRRCEDWFVGPRIDRGELEGSARRCFERRVVAGEEIQ